MAQIFNEQRVLGVRVVPDGTTMYLGEPTIGVRDTAVSLFTQNLRTLGVAVLAADQQLYNDQQVVGAVVISDGRTLYNNQLVLPASTLTGLPIATASLSLNFLSGETLDPSISASGGANGTRVNSSGVLVAATAPRYDYNPATLAARGILIEAARTNLVLQSDAFDNVAWTKSGSTVTANATASPAGTATGDKLVEDAANTAHWLYQVATTSATVLNTWSFYAKAGERTRVYGGLADGAGTNGVGATFDLVAMTAATLTFGTGSGVSATITDAGGGWRRCTVSGIPAAAGASVQASIYLDNGSGISYQGNGTSGAFIWGAQLEVGAFPTSYIPTVAASVTRSADVLTMTGANFSSWFNQSEGTFVVACDTASITGMSALAANDGTANDRHLINATAAAALVQVTDGGATQASLALSAFTANASFKVAYSYKVNDFAASKDGAAVVTDVSGTIPTPNRLLLGSNGSTYLNGHLSSVSYWNTRLANSQLQALSV